MPTYEVRQYFTYVDTYQVEAESPEAAADGVDAWSRAGRPDHGPVIQVADNAYVDYDSTCVEDEHGRIYEL